MDFLPALVASHPIRKKPYNAIKYVRTDHAGTPLYRVAKDLREIGASEALKTAFERFGAHCFHCKTWMPAQPMSQSCTRDHVRPKKDGGRGYLHNLVFACGECNRRKGGKGIISFDFERGAEYMSALEAHLARCIDGLRQASIVNAQPGLSSLHCVAASHQELRGPLPAPPKRPDQ